MLADIRFAIRIFGKSPEFTPLVVLALAIGANSDLFSVINFVLLKPLSFRGRDKLTGLYGT